MKKLFLIYMLLLNSIYMVAGIPTIDVKTFTEKYYLETLGNVRRAYTQDEIHSVEDYPESEREAHRKTLRLVAKIKTVDGEDRVLVCVSNKLRKKTYECVILSGVLIVENVNPELSEEFFKLLYGLWTGTRRSFEEAIPSTWRK